MFTGLIQAVGRIEAITPTLAGRRLVVAADWDYEPAPGASVSVNGVCLTAVIDDAGAFAATEPDGRTPSIASSSSAAAASVWTRGVAFDAVSETLARSALGDLEAGDRVNLEHAARADSLLGGHVVQGHVDAVGTVRSVQRNPDDWRLTVAVPDETLMYIAPKGSVTIDGVSLTVAEAGDDDFTVVLIPTTLAKTTLEALQPGRRVNVETDIIARQVVHALQRMGVLAEAARPDADAKAGGQ